MFVALIAALALSAPALAGGPEVPAHLGKGMHVRVSETLEQSPEEVWQLVAHDFVSIDKWVDGVDHSRVLGAHELPEGFTADSDAPLLGRVVTTGGQESQHVLIDFDEAARTYTFRSGGLPGLLAYAHNTHTVVALPDGGTELQVDVYLVPQGIAKLMRGRIEKEFGAYMADYLAQIEAYASTETASAGS